MEFIVGPVILGGILLEDHLPGIELGGTLEDKVILVCFLLSTTGHVAMGILFPDSLSEGPAREPVSFESPPYSPGPVR